MVKNMALSSFLNVGGIDFPCPRYGFTYTISTAVSAGRNANNQVIGQKVGRDIYKLDNISFVGLSNAQVHQILSIFEHSFYVPVTFEDQRTGQPITIMMYPSDRTGKPLFVDKSTHMVSKQESLTFSLVDCGWD